MLLVRYPVLRFVVALLLAAMGLALLWLPPQVAQLSGYDALTARAETVVDAVTEQNMKAFIALSGVKAALAIVEGSSVGVGFQLELGDAVQSVYDYIDFVWHMLMYSLLILGAYKLLLETGLLYLGLQVIGAGLLVWGIGMAIQRVPGKVRVLGQRVVLVGILFAYVVPFALLATHYGTTHYTGPLKEKHAQQIGDLHSQMDKLTAQLSALKSEVTIFAPLDSVDAVRRRITDIGSSISSAVQGSMQAMLYYIAIILFELLVFPLISAYLLFKFLQLALGRVLDRPVVIKQAPPPAPLPALADK
jgi:hypothetical protein